MKKERLTIDTSKLLLNEGQLEWLPSNPRTWTRQDLDKLKASIERDPDFLEDRPALIVPYTKGKFIVFGGNMRTAACEEMNRPTIPAMKYIPETDDDRETIKRRALLDNGSFGAWDFDELANKWDDLPLTDWGVPAWEEEEEEEELEVVEDDFDIPDEIETDIVLGDLFEIGEHRLLCGDSTDSDSVAKLMNGEKADMVLSDPPYGMFLDADYSSLNWGDRKGKKYDNVIGDHDDFDPELINTFFKHFDYCKEMFLWGADYYFELLPDFKKGNYIVWDKTLESNGDAGSNSEYELCWSRQKHKRVVLHFNWFRYFGLQSQDTKTRVHPTQKPLEVNNHFIERYSKEQDKIIDLYLGSGSTMVAAHQLKRKCYGMELDCKYAEVIVRRMIKLDNTITIKRNGIDETQKWLDKLS